VQLGSKLGRYRLQFGLEEREVSERTGIPTESIKLIERGLQAPTGDQLLILADLFLCDYKFFLSNERLAPFEQTESLFRRYGQDLSREDRWAIQELLFLCENEEFLQDALGRRPKMIPAFTPRGAYYKQQGWDAAGYVRGALGLADKEVVQDPFPLFRSLGLHVFRRRLENSNISGVFIKHPLAGRCVLVNYDEDPYRQRFTASHEVAHAILDADEPEPTISFQGPDGDLREVRANAFASAFLVPPESIKHLDPNLLSEDAFLDLCNRLMVNTQTLIIAFKNFNGVSENVLSRFSHLRVRRLNKPDPELGPDLTSTSRERRQRLLEKGISFQYVRLCFDAHREGVISLPRLAEVLLLDLGETLKLMASFKEVPQYAH